MELPFYRINAFTGTGKLGNPAGICLPDESLDPDKMQEIARNLDLPATVFYYPHLNNQIRWFTPQIEIQLCGHGTLALSHLLLNVLNKNEDSIEYSTAFGDVLKAQKLGDQIELDFPAIILTELPVDKRLEEALGVNILKSFSGSRPIVLLESAEAVKKVKPNFELLFELFDGIGVTAAGDGIEADIVSRCFYKTVSNFEDPVTGSLHCALSPLWFQLSGKTKLKAYQASERGGILTTELQDDRILLKATAELIVAGTIHV